MLITIKSILNSLVVEICIDPFHRIYPGYGGCERIEWDTGALLKSGTHLNSETR